MRLDDFDPNDIDVGEARGGGGGFRRRVAAAGCCSGCYR